MLRCQGCRNSRYAYSSKRAESAFDCLIRCKRCGQPKRLNKLFALLFARPSAPHSQEDGPARIKPPVEPIVAAAHPPEGDPYKQSLAALQAATWATNSKANQAPGTAGDAALSWRARPTAPQQSPVGPMVRPQRM